ncbi:hypothetical protein E3P91_03156 [Wallemia ichthyophaga]|nr:hypothetical protein E3P91_03156 [Wallemia ichthyophaga]TIB60073.1 hypothetical protein E3P78_03289 [Wallemia ichthyophaga]
MHYILARYRAPNPITAPTHAHPPSNWYSGSHVRLRLAVEIDTRGTSSSGIASGETSARMTSANLTTMSISVLKRAARSSGRRSLCTARTSKYTTPPNPVLSPALSPASTASLTLSDSPGSVSSRTPSMPVRSVIFIMLFVIVIRSCFSPAGFKKHHVAAPDPFRNKALGASASTSKAGKTEERDDLGKNKLLSKNRYLPYAAKDGGSKCKVCKQATARPDARYCQNCAYKRGKCSVCGVKQMDTTYQKMSAK